MMMTIWGAASERGGSWLDGNCLWFNQRESRKPVGECIQGSGVGQHGASSDQVAVRVTSAKWRTLEAR